jgi:hypothetical protein
MAECAQARLEIARLETQRIARTAELEAHRTAHAAELAAIRDSTSWRLTYPVRQVGRVIAKFRR